MRNVAVWITLAVIGFAFMFVSGFLFAGSNGAMFGMIAGLLMFLPILQFYGVAKRKGFLPLYLNLKPTEKFIHFPDKFGRLHTMIVNTRDVGICHKKDMGFIDDKGDEYAWGNSKASFGHPLLGVTVDVKNAHYTELLDKNRQIEDYDQAIKQFFGDEDYKTWCEAYRKKENPDIYDINNELDSITKWEEPDNKLEHKVFGETWGFKNFARYLKYAFNPMALENAIERAKIWAQREAMGYKDTEKAMGYAKAIGYILFIAMIVIVVLNAIGFQGIGNLLGME